MRDLRDLRAFRVDQSCLFGCHLGLERCRSGRFFEASDGSPPLGPRVPGSAPAAQRAVGTCRLGPAVHARMYAVATNLQSEMSEEPTALCWTGRDRRECDPDLTPSRP